jgi:hypothetical protein
MSGPTYHDEGSRLRKLASNKSTKWKFSDHALCEMSKDKVTRSSVQSMLKNCRVVRVEQNRFKEVWNAEGFDRDGNTITAVINVYECSLVIKVVTAWKHK